MKVMLKSQEKAVDRMIDLKSKVSSVYKLVADIYAGTLNSVKACL